MIYNQNNSVKFTVSTSLSNKSTYLPNLLYLWLSVVTIDNLLTYPVVVTTFAWEILYHACNNYVTSWFPCLIIGFWWYLMIADALARYYTATKRPKLSKKTVGSWFLEIKKKMDHIRSIMSWSLIEVIRWVNFFFKKWVMSIIPL